MKITDIKQQERLKGRYSVYVDEKYAFSLSANALLDQKIYPGQEIDEAELKNYKKLSQDDKAFNLTLAYVARRLRSRYELEQYLKRKGYEEDVAETILQRLEKLNLINDEAFARAWVNDRHLLKPTSQRKLSAELRQKRIANNIIQKVLAADQTDELTTLRELITRKRRQTKYQDDIKLMQYLARQGFRYGDIKTALNGEVDLID